MSVVEEEIIFNAKLDTLCLASNKMLSFHLDEKVQGRVKVIGPDIINQSLYSIDCDICFTVAETTEGMG